MNITIKCHIYIYIYIYTLNIYTNMYTLNKYINIHTVSHLILFNYLNYEIENLKNYFPYFWLKKINASYSLIYV